MTDNLDSNYMIVDEEGWVEQAVVSVVKILSRIST